MSNFLEFGMPLHLDQKDTIKVAVTKLRWVGVNREREVIRCVCPALALCSEYPARSQKHGILGIITASLGKHPREELFGLGIAILAGVAVFSKIG